MLGRQVWELVQRHAVANRTVADVTTVAADGSDRRVFQKAPRWWCLDRWYQTSLSQIFRRFVAYRKKVFHNQKCRHKILRILRVLYAYANVIANEEKNLQARKAAPLATKEIFLSIYDLYINYTYTLFFKYIIVIIFCFVYIYFLLAEEFTKRIRKLRFFNIISISQPQFCQNEYSTIIIESQRYTNQWFAVEWYPDSFHRSRWDHRCCRASWTGYWDASHPRADCIPLEIVAPFV